MSDDRLLRLLGRRDVVALAFGAMIGWSWVVLSGAWIAGAGTLGAVLAFLVGGGVMILVGLTYAELAAAMPFAGGEHVYSERALGSGASFVCTWAIVLGYVSVCAFEAVALPTVVDAFVPGLDALPLWTVAGWTVTLPWVLVGVIAAIAVTCVNVVGIRVAAIVQSIVVCVIVAVGVAFLAGIALSDPVGDLEPLFVDAPRGALGVLIMVPFLFVGFDVIPQAAEEIDLPAPVLGRLLIFSVLLAAAWYALIVLGVSLALSADARAASELVTADAMRAVWGTPGATALVLAGLGGILTSWNAFMVGGSRAIFAMARAGQLPAVLGRLHPRYGTPHNAIMLIGLLSVVAPLFGRPALVWLVDAGGLGIVLAYAMVALSFIVLRRRAPDMDRPYRVPAGGLIGGLALVSALSLAGLYLPGSPSALLWPEEWGIVIAWAVLGAGFFALAPGPGRRSS